MYARFSTGFEPPTRFVAPPLFRLCVWRESLPDTPTAAQLQSSLTIIHNAIHADSVRRATGLCPQATAAWPLAPRATFIITLYHFKRTWEMCPTIHYRLIGGRVLYFGSIHKALNFRNKPNLLNYDEELAKRRTVCWKLTYVANRETV